MADLKNMTAVAAIRHAKDVSGLTASELAKRVGVSVSVINRYLKEDDDYTPSLEYLPAVCQALGNAIPLQWLEAQLEICPEEDVPPAQSRADVLTAVSRAGAALGDVQRLVAETGYIQPHHARQIRSALDDVIAECRVAKGRLQPLAAHHDQSYTPLASLRPESLVCPQLEQKHPWWKFWERRDI